VEGVSAAAAIAPAETSAPLARGAFAQALEAGRERFNAQVASARRSVPGFDPERFGRRFVVTAGPVVEAVAVLAPDRAPQVTDRLFDISLTLAIRGSLGPTVGPLADEAWTRVLPSVASLVAQSPDRLVSAATNAVYNIALVAGTRPRDWIARMTIAGPACANVDEWLACGQVAAWLSGVAHMRDGALEALATLSPRTARTVLNLPANASPLDVPAIAARLRSDPWLPPDRVETASAVRGLQIVATVGGFRGLGGLFMIPPDIAMSEGRIVAFDGRRSWILSADCCGATLVRTESVDLDAEEKTATEGIFELGSGGRVSFGTYTRAFPTFAEVSSFAATPTTLAVAIPRSHYIYVVALVERG
jgi:hypothetical protein